LTRIDRWIPVVLGAVFVAAGVLKIADPLAFAVSIARLRLVPTAMIGPVAILLPWVEVVAGLALFVPAFRLPALKLLLALLGGFTVILGIGLLRGTGGSCGCFGTADAFLNRSDVAVARNAVLIALAVLLIRRKPTSPATPASPASDTAR
jgi:putative oxidoreductase